MKNTRTKGKKKKSKVDVDETVSSRVREGVFLAIASISIFIFISLASHNNSDPGWSHIKSTSQVLNFAGSWGAWISDFILYFFGYVSFFVPVGVLLVSSRILRLEENNPKQENSKWLWPINFLGLMLTIIGTCGIAELHLPLSSNLLPSSQGGIIGGIAVSGLHFTLNRFGTELVFIALTLIGLTLSFGVSWILLCEKTGRQVISILHKIALLTWKASSQLISVMNKARSRIFDLARKENIKSFFSPVIEVKSRASLESREETMLIEAVAVSQDTYERSISVPEVKTPSKRDKSEPEVFKVKSQKNVKKITSVVGTPGVDLIEDSEQDNNQAYFSEEDLKQLAVMLEKNLQDFNVEAKVEGILPGPIITRFELSLGAGTKVSKITALSKDLARSLLVTSVRIVEVIPGKSFIGIEVPNKQREIVQFSDIIKSPQYQDRKAKIPLALGKDIAGAPVIADLARMPHLLVAGTTGSGKSVGINSMLLSMLYGLKVEDLRLLLIDPKMLELSIYEGIPHLLTPVITDMNEAAGGLRWCVAEMDRRYELLASLGVRNLKSYNDKITLAEKNGKPIVDPTWKKDPSEAPTLEKLPYIVVIIDEFADMIMVVGKKVEELIARIAQKARAAGIHMILATQRPSVDVITGLIKANVPTRISFQVSSKIDSRTILDQQGAEQLLGHGDMLYLAPGTGIPMRVHGPFVSDETVHSVVQYFKDNYQEVEESIDLSSSSFASDSSSSSCDDDMYSEAINIVLETGKSSSSYLQRRLKIGYNRAARLVEAMEENGILGPMQSNGVREILIRKD